MQLKIIPQDTLHFGDTAGFRQGPIVGALGAIVGSVVSGVVSGVTGNECPVVVGTLELRIVYYGARSLSICISAVPSGCKRFNTGYG